MVLGWKVKEFLFRNTEELIRVPRVSPEFSRINEKLYHHSFSRQRRNSRMTVRKFQIEVDDATYQAMLERGQGEGKLVGQILEELITAYARGEAGKLTTYTVQAGDTLAQIARRVYGDPYKYPLIQNANNIDHTGRIWVGQVLVIPQIAAASPTPPTPTPTPSPSPPAPPTPPEPVPPSPQPIPPPPEPVPSPAQPTLSDYVRAMPKGFRPDRAGTLQATYQFQLTGVGSGTWTVFVANRTCSVAEGSTPLPSVAIGMSGTDFIKLAQGQLDTNQAYRQGKIRIGGDLNLAARIPDIFGPWANFVAVSPTPAPTPTPAPPPSPQPTGPINPTLLNGSFDDYQPYVRDGEAKVWKEPQFSEQYGAHWTLQLISEVKSRVHLMDSGTFGRFTQKYFGGGGLDYHIHGKHSQVVASRYGFDLVFFQTVAAQEGREYTFRGSIVSFYKGTSGERADGKIFKTIGLDPTGNREWNRPSVIWGEGDGKDNEWRYPVVRTVARTNAITVFIRLENTERDVGQTELNIVHLEDFRLE
ncbi:MAG: SCP2 sterol-binding domain-containing protein [Anaerolineae bacterium]|nr:SCP2 sterol-binding domain-containing protein [Anaerolineae bacterium]